MTYEISPIVSHYPMSLENSLTSYDTENLGSMIILNNVGIPF